MGKKKAAAGKGGDAGADGQEVRKCVECGEKKPRDAYTGGMWKKTDRQCRACAEAEEALLAPAAEKMQREREEAKQKREEEERAKKERLSSAPLSDRAREKLHSIACDRVLCSVSRAEGASPSDKLTLATAREYAQHLGVDIAGHCDLGDISAALVACATEVFMKKPSPERGLSYAFTNSLAMDELQGLACEMDILHEDWEGLARAELTEAIRVAARGRANVRICETCGKWWGKADFNQSQWKKANGSRCKLCMKVEEDEKRYFEEFERIYGHPPVMDEEEDVYTSQEDLYETLHVEREATADEIKKSYRTLAIRFHPDRWASAEPEKRAEKEEAFKLITEAYETLSNPDKKKQYDKDLQKKDKRKKKKEAAAAAKEQGA